MNTVLKGIIPGIIDTHLHQWDPLTTPRESSAVARIYPYAPKLIDKLTPWVKDQGTCDFIITPKHVATPYLPEQYAADVAGTVAAVGVAVTAAVHVEAGWHAKNPSDETVWLETLPFEQQGRPRLAGIVGRADPRKADFASTLDAHARASTRFRGIRCLTSWHDDPGVKRWIADEKVLASREFLLGFAELAKRGLTFDAYVYSTQLREVVTLAREYPETTIILDHYATPVGWLGPMGRYTGRSRSAQADIFAHWCDAMAEVAQFPNIISKQSGLAFPMLGLKQVGIARAALAERVAPMVEHAVNVFGENRIMFGSNFPVDKSIASYSTIVGALADILAPRGPELLRKLFHDNAVDVYRLSTEA
ncbi:amidohydrolase family protein [Pseudomonas piscis]|uniref:Amidohydrolase family protein n=1 Tax=Pseudomonas piscis TaxID=2614538 RepID=A0A7X1PNE3_9PSED|nr:amidohydrolase family protein [Pseudomonas piscis]MQA55436.1 amidohydrolase family protein [Pseudomonas piscis]